MSHQGAEQQVGGEWHNQTWLDLLWDRAMVETVREMYPAEAQELELDRLEDHTITPEDHLDDYRELYSQSYHDFHFAQSRTRELAYLTLFMQKVPIESAAAGKAADGIEELRKLAHEHGITDEEFKRIQQLAVHALKDAPWESRADVLDWEETGRFLEVN